LKEKIMADPNDEFTAGSGFHHKSWNEPGPWLPRWVYKLAALLLAFAGLILIGDAILP
jgi:hypothetical protein